MFASTPNMLADYSVPLKPYSIMEIDSSNMNIKTKDLPRIQNNKVALSASGGLDSTTVAYMLKEQGYDVTLIHFKYDCLAQEKEVDYIKKIAKHGDFDLHFIQMPDVMRGTITEGKYHKSQIEGTEYAMDWVSGRNLLMLSILTAWAESNKFGYIAFGGNLEESGAYPDNEQEFGRKFNEILPFATQNKVKIELLQPISTMMKHEIVKEGVKLKVPYELTWSCYSNDNVHCNNCAPCFMRRVAFERNGWTDPVFV
jgi:7-cyano-7-deazaguanine synthase